MAGATVTVRSSLPRYTLEEWRTEAQRLGGEEMLDTPLRCPLCKNVATPRQFKDAGADPNRAARECIGRVTGAKGGLTKPTTEAYQQPCDWAAFGLFGTLNDGVIVVYPDGHEINAFAFAEP